MIELLKVDREDKGYTKHTLSKEVSLLFFM